MLLTPLLSASPLAVPLLAQYDDHSIRNANQRTIESIKIQFTARSLTNDLHLTTVAPTKWSQIEKYQSPIDENTSKSIGNVDESIESWSRAITNDSPGSKRASRQTSNRVNNFEFRKSLSDRTFFSNGDLIHFNYGTNGNNRQQDAILGANTSLSFSNVHNNVNFKRRFLSAIATDQISLLGERTTDRQAASPDSNHFKNINNSNSNQLLFVNSSALKLSKSVRSVSASVGENSSASENIRVPKSHYRDSNGGSGSDVIDGVLENDLWKIPTTTTTTDKNATNHSISSSTSSSVPSEIQKENGNKTVFKAYGYIIAVVAISLIGAFAITLVGAVRCLRATRRASRALALPIPLLPEDRTPLNAEPEHPVPMLSVQSPGYAGMERLGVPARTSLGSPPHDRNHIGRRMRVDPLSRDILVRDVRNHHNNAYHYQQHHFHQTLNLTTNDGSININNGRTSGNSENDFNATTTTTSGDEMRNSGGHSNNSNSRIDNNYRGSGRPEERRCPHHVPLPDSEWGQDRTLQIRTNYQQAEITRSYITPPPNRTVLDVPEQSYNIFPPSSSLPPFNGMAATSCNLGPNQHHLIQHSTPHLSQNHHHHQQQQQPQQQQHQQQKSKPSLIKNFFMKMGSPKSPSSSSSPSPSLSASSSSSSTSSSSSSSSSLAHPNSAVQSSVNTTNYNPGSRLGSLSTLSVVTSSATATVIPLMANVTTISGSSNNHHHHHHQHHHHFHQTQQQPQQQLVGSTNHNSLSVVGSSCTASLGSSSSSSSSTSSSTSSIASLATQSIDCCYTQATSVRPRTPSVNNSVSSHATTTTEIGTNHNNNNQQPSHHQHQRDGHI